MDLLRRLVLSLFSVVLGVVLSLITMIYGWGLQPKSWAVIIGLGVFGQIVVVLMAVISQDK